MLLPPDNPDNNNLHIKYLLHLHFGTEAQTLTDLSME